MYSPWCRRDASRACAPRAPHSQPWHGLCPRYNISRSALTGPVFLVEIPDASKNSRDAGITEMSVVEEVSAERVRAHVEHITTKIPSRLAGSQNASRMAQYSAGALAKEGIAARVLQMPGLVSFPDK